MGYKETVMSEEQIVEAIKEARKDTVKTYARYRAVSRKQAGITGPIAEKAGIQKVVDWLNDNCLGCRSFTPCNHDDYLGFHKGDWQAFLKEVEK